MSGFQFTPDGIVPLGPPSVAEAIAPATTQPVRQPEAAPTPVVRAVAKPVSVPPLTPTNIVKLARARLSEVEREIKRLKALETERDELKRLLDAAANKPLAVVRNLTAKRGL